MVLSSVYVLTTLAVAISCFGSAKADVNLVFDLKISALLPFVPILQGENRQDKLRDRSQAVKTG
ncbi:MAG: hypothetical protein ACKO9I_18900 [Sphaerospermopsis kisseleviana]|uniref:Uncharacterized protein n=1 Tax=Sphaerospermopsis kisseleviana CS-549 TaxID=3021783 RepID=A0ABT4ZUC1_9CYAN|nr:hypothetical protein [Sphaerospermopsis kisseleviana]MDB9443007.1 hypothetical protein [Sphaerospermopsis kisseleviana CS-549]